MKLERVVTTVSTMDIDNDTILRNIVKQDNCSWGRNGFDGEMEAQAACRGPS